jgi:putative transcriptional regulator
MPARTGLLAAALLATTAAAPDAPSGILLVARPDLADPNFRETVVLVTRHAGGGAVGVVLNRPTAVALGQALPEHQALQSRPDRLFAGGPVSPRTLVAVFRSRERPADALRIMPDVYLSLHGATLDGLFRGPDIPRDLRVYAGYAGWAPGQLEMEIAREAWYVLEADAESIFRADPATLWRALLRRASALSVRAPPPALPGPGASVADHHRHAGRHVGRALEIVHAEHHVAFRGDVDRVDVDAGRGQDERHLAQRARLVEDPHDEDLARRVREPGRVEGAPGAIGAVGHEADDGSSALAGPLDRLDVHARLAERLPETGQAAGHVGEGHGELGGHGEPATSRDGS